MTKYLKDKDGKILRYATGDPVPYDHFDNDPMDGDDDFSMTKEETVECFDRMLERGVSIAPAVLKKAGYELVSGKWIHTGK